MAKKRTVARSHVLLVMLSALAMSQTPPGLTSPSSLLERARAKLMSDMSRQSRYTCVQNITRRFYDSRSKQRDNCANIAAQGKDQLSNERLVYSDRLQLDVAIADNHEIHSWPGASSFNEEEIREVVTNGGPFGSGDFAGFIVGIFGGSAEIKFIRSMAIKGRQVFEYAFDVPRDASTYAISYSGESVTTAYSGSFLLDQGGDLIQLSVRTAELADVSNACIATSEIRYQRIALHAQDVLVPHETELRTIFSDRSQTVSTTSYSNCHEYTARSLIRFDMADAAPAKTTSRSEKAVASKKQTTVLPTGLLFQCKIVTPLDSETQAGGVIQAVLSTPLVGQNGEILAPLGSRIRGRLVRLAHYTSPDKYFEADVRLDTIEVNGNEVQLYAVPAHADTRTRVSDFASTAPRNVGAFFFDGKHLSVRQWDSTWLITVPTPSRRTSDEQPREVSHAQQTISEKESAENFVWALHYEQQASDLQNATTSAAQLRDNPNLPLILSYRQKAIEAGRAVNLDQLNDLYPRLGDRFSSQFLDSLTLFVHSCNVQTKSESVSREELSRSILLSAEWANWYEPLRSVIDAAIRSGAFNSSPTHE